VINTPDDIKVNVAFFQAHWTAAEHSVNTSLLPMRGLWRLLLNGRL
jgi:hypothetical protein